MLLVFCMRPWTIPKDSSGVKLTAVVRKWSFTRARSMPLGRLARNSCQIPGHFKRKVSCATWKRGSGAMSTNMLTWNARRLRCWTAPDSSRTAKRSSGHEADRNGIFCGKIPKLFKSRPHFLQMFGQDNACFAVATTTCFFEIGATEAQFLGRRVVVTRILSY